jgi:hypothetical protein
MNVIEAALMQNERQRQGRDIEQLFVELTAIRDQLRRLHEQLEIVRHLQDR